MANADNDLRRWLAAMSLERSVKVSHHTRWGIRISTTLFVTAFLFGVWDDWRWFLTSIIPLACMVYYTILSSYLKQDMLRRIDESKAPQ